jgi:HK97 family phage major capsid protein
MIGDTLKVAGFDASDNSGGAPFGFTAQWLQEGGEATDTSPKVRKIELKTKKLAIFTVASNELAGDAQDFEGQLNRTLTQAIGWCLDFAFLRGTGAGQPRGVLNDPALVTQPKEALQAADTITYENLVGMLALLHPSCYKNAIWVCSPTAIPQLLTLGIFLGLAGSPVPVLQSLSANEFTLLTRPVLFTEKVPAIGEKGDIVLADFSKYTIGLRKELSIVKSFHVRWQSDESSYRAICRVDGQGQWNKAMTPKNGNPQSWCVALQAR